jgi:hypothetical protein
MRSATMLAPSPRPAGHDAAATNEVTKLRHDPLRPWRWCIEARKVGRSVEHFRRFQLVENKETMDVSSRGAEHARPKESLRRHPFGGVLARQPMPVVGQVVGRDVAPDG